MLTTFLLKKNSSIVHKNFLNYKMSYFLNSKSYTIYKKIFDALNKKYFHSIKKKNLNFLLSGFIFIISKLKKRKQRRLTSMLTITTLQELQVSIRDQFRSCSKDSSGGRTKTARDCFVLLTRNTRLV